MIDDALTRSVYKDSLLQQRAEVMQVFPKLINELAPKRIIEIGTGHGGLTHFLQDLVRADLHTFDPAAQSTINSFVCDIHTFDILNRETHLRVANSGVNIYIENIFIDPPKSWTKYEVSPKWVSLFTQKKPLLVLVDGGNKIAEFNAIADLLSPGDVIMLHDYAYDKEEFERLKVWKWMEAQYSSIKEACDKNNLKPYMREEFSSVAWGCFKKIS